MSAWKVLIRNLHAIGGEGVFCQFDAPEFSFEACRSALQAAKHMGLVKNNGGIGVHCWWTLTPLGRAYCENRVAPVWRRGDERRPRGQQRAFRFLPTWLSSLPDDIRLGAA